jgi:CDP-paratose 2-epimerase
MVVVGIDNDMRGNFFGPAASTARTRIDLETNFRNYQHHKIDIRNPDAIDRLFRTYERNIKLIIHAAAQPSHDWSAKNPGTDFAVNAIGTSILLERALKWAPEAAFIFISTNKVYGTTPNTLPFIEHRTRWEISAAHPFSDGIPETMSIDQSMHSPFGASKLAADVLVQEYGKYFGMKTVCFRCGCITGANHAGIELHGFLSYLMRCAIERRAYTINGYMGKQVRDNLHSSDLARACEQFFRSPTSCGEVYNMGGGRTSSCSVLEAIAFTEGITGERLAVEYNPAERLGDHQWWISSTAKFRRHYPRWFVTFKTLPILKDIFESNADRWRQPA